MRTLFLTFIVLGAAFWGCAQNVSEPIVIPLWDNGSAPHSNELQGPEIEEEPNRIANTTEATLYLFKADPERATGQAVLLCPGGGYRRLAIDNEGFHMAEWLSKEGIACAVLKYRMPNGHPEVPLEDAVRALEVMREGATAWGFNPEKVGIAGCSAGGHLAAMTSTMGRIRPAFSILFYPVITGEEGRCHKGSFDRLLGEGRTDVESRPYWLEERVDSLTPPTLLLLSDDDRSVPPISSTRYYNALKEVGQQASMHIYPSGGHGWGMKDSFAYKSDWQATLLDWLKQVE
uniref:alpha/beta hydrolase n=1 Tax=Alistipes sp. TaxID=1872444 RepID=UPI004055AF94